MNPMQKVRIEKITLNVGAGKDQAKLEKGIKLLNTVTGIKPVTTFTQKRIPTWGLRPGLPIGCMITLRKEQANALLPKLLESKDKILKESQFDNNGNVSFGVPEYIDIPGIEYDPEIGVMGFEVCVTLEKPGFRIKKRRVKKKKLHQNHRITRKEAMKFMQEKFNVKYGEAE